MRIVIIGAGGQARDAAWLASDITRFGSERFDVVGFVVTDLERLEATDSEVLGDERFLHEHREAFDGLVLGIGTPAVRLLLADQLMRQFPDVAWPSLIHPSAQFEAETASIGPGAMVAAGVIGTVHLHVEAFALLNPAVTLGHEARVGPGCVMNHAAGISGGTVLEEGVLIGTGARVLQYLTVGANATVGAGAVVTKDVAPGTTVVGIPARPMRS